MKSTPKDLMRGFIATLLLVAFIATNVAFLFSYLVLDKPLETVGTAALMSLINFAGLAVGYYLGSSKGSTDKNPLPPEPVEPA